MAYNFIVYLSDQTTLLEECSNQYGGRNLKRLTRCMYLDKRKPGYFSLAAIVLKTQINTRGSIHFR